MKKKFELDDILTVAKRENNAIRSFLYVNPLQGKHIPVSPSLALELFSILASKVESGYAGEKILVIGFAETATAIGAAIACGAKNVEFYINTTREDVPDTQHLFFTESHSHATEQKLVTKGLDEVIAKVDRIVFAEDEVTTGNTIEKLMNALRNYYKSNLLKFGIVSILNSMSEERLQQLGSQGVDCKYIHHIPVHYRIGEIDGYSFAKQDKSAPCVSISVAKQGNIEKNYWNSRIVSDVTNIREKTNQFVASCLQMIGNVNAGEKILLLGTEEFMFPGMLVGQKIERLNSDVMVKFHATTRSPIEVCDDEKYPLHSRYELPSLYEAGRRTFVYNLDEYDLVFVFTDAQTINAKGMKTLMGALEKKENTNITFIRWKDTV